MFGSSVALGFCGVLSLACFYLMLRDNWKIFERGLTW
jgi:hypothetical protein